MECKKILLLCKVIDNYGDIGVVYRLAKALSDAGSSLELTISCSNLESFSLMAKSIDPSKKEQTFKYKDSTWTILEWNQPVKGDVPEVILECFQCGRPDWLENLLFSPDNTTVYRLFNIEYLTAEDYADDFHLLKSYTRSSYIKKMFYMPGFTSKTAGLVIDSQFKKSLDQSKLRKKDNNTFTVVLFSYERDFVQIFNALNRFQNRHKTDNPDFTVKVLAANGKSLSYARDGWKKSGKKVEFEELPFLQQEQWDEVLCNSDLNFIRGEESLARAALTGIPFVWHAYLQDDNYQLVKVDALLDKLCPFIQDSNTAKSIRTLWDDYNTPQKELKDEDLDLLLEETFSKKLSADFGIFAENLLKNGNLAENLLEYISSLTR